MERVTKSQERTLLHLLEELRQQRAARGTCALSDTCSQQPSLKSEWIGAESSSLNRTMKRCL